MVSRSIWLLCLGALAMANSNAAAADEPVGRVVGVGGVFFKAKDPKMLAAWYHEVLGMPVEAWGGAALRYDTPNHPPVLTWSAFSASTTYFAPSTSAFMINYAVDNMDALIARLHAKKRPDSEAGR
jgi:catechol-2,3-dioxygenase